MLTLPKMLKLSIRLQKISNVAK